MAKYKISLSRSVEEVVDVEVEADSKDEVWDAVLGMDWDDMDWKATGNIDILTDADEVADQLEDLDEEE